MRWLRFAVGLLIALTLHSLLDSFFPNALAFFNPYVILVVYYSMGGNVFGAIIAGVIAGLVQDAYSGAMFGLHAFALTVCAYAVAYINSRLVLRGTLPFGACLDRRGDRQRARDLHPRQHPAEAENRDVRAGDDREDDLHLSLRNARVSAADACSCAKSRSRPRAAAVVIVGRRVGR